jgi:hypothetical protein
MKEYKDSPDSGNDSLKEPVAVYGVRETIEFKIPRDENGNPIGHTLDEVFDTLDREWSETSGIDFLKVSRMLRSGELDLDELTDEILLSPEFKYEPYPEFIPKPRKTPNFSPEWLAALNDIFEPEQTEELNGL